MARQLRMHARGVIEYRHFGSNDGIGTQCGSLVHRRVPVLQAHTVRVGIQRQIDFGVARMRVANAGTQLVVGEVQAGKRARIGLVTETGVNRVRPGVHRRLQGRQVAGGTHQLHDKGFRMESAHDPLATDMRP